MTRTGKIARLPLDVREELNRRLQNGEKGRKLLAWLNQLPETKRVLAEDFGGRDITEVNLSDWKKGGYTEWLGREAFWEQSQELSVRAEELAAVTEGRLTEHLSTLLAMRYAALMGDWSDVSSAEFQRKLRALRPLSDSILALRRGDHNVIRMRLQQAGGERQMKAHGACLGTMGEHDNEFERLRRMVTGEAT